MLNLADTAVPLATEQIIQAMRAELEEYGAVLNLLDQQEEAILECKRCLVRELGEVIDARLETVGAWGSQRDPLIAALPLHSGTESPSFFHTAALFPQPMRLLVEALGNEVNRLTFRVLRRIHQNRMLEARTTSCGGIQDLYAAGS